MDRMTPADRAAHIAHHTQQVTNHVAIIAGNIARLRDLTDDAETDAAYRQMLTQLGEMSTTIRRMNTDTKEAA